MSEIENSQTVQSEVEEKKLKQERKQKPKQLTQTVDPKSATFPVEEFVNQYGFIRLSREALEAFVVRKTGDIKKPYEKTNITINFKDGALIITK